MKTKPIYYAIQFVYVLLWACQLVVCHMTHSLIILTDSYINLYKILDISLGILHLGTQSELTKGRLASGERPTKEQQERPALAGRLFNRTCTYQFKRLPLLGAFVNGLFLAALLMSAAIEGIQTCVHSGHSQSPHLESLLHQHRLTYPLILLGFALVGLVMQHCSLKAHLMRDEELLSESLLDLRRHELAPSSADGQASKQKRNEIVPIVMRELNINQLGMGEPKRRSAASVKRQSYDFNVAPQRSGSAAGSSSRSQSRQSSLKELHDVVPNNCEGRISLRSLRLSANLESIVADCEPIRSVSRDLEASSRVRQVARASSSWRAKDKWFLVRYLASPLALLAYAAINYSLTDELLTEIADAFLSICVVFLLFAASYPPMKKAGLVLLQTTPDGVDLTLLEKELIALSAHILEVRNLHVWSLTPGSNRVATCELVLDKSLAANEKLVELIISEAKYRFLDQNIKCTTIEPKFGPEPTEAAH